MNAGFNSSRTGFMSMRDDQQTEQTQRVDAEQNLALSNVPQEMSRIDLAKNELGITDK